MPADVAACASLDSGAACGSNGSCYDAACVTSEAGPVAHLVSPTTLDLTAVSATSRSNVFIVGKAWTVLH